MGRPPIAVLVVDDSAAVRGLISRMIETENDMSVVATAVNGLHAVQQLQRSAANVVVLDIEMPVMNGLEAIPRLLEVDPSAKILIASTLSTKNATIALQALQAGAADYLAKPTSSRGLTSVRESGLEFRDELVRKVRSLGEVAAKRSETRKGRTSLEPPATGLKHAWPPAVVLSRVVRPAAPPEVLAIGSSTGGPQALLSVFQGLGRDYPLPILVTQHMPQPFTSILAGHITDRSGITCAEAKDGEQIVPGRAYIAPGGLHMTVHRVGSTVVAKLDDGPPVNFCRPAVDPMFRTAAHCYGGRVLAAILTGMGSDGAKGGQEVFAAGGTIIAQDQETSVVWGMPGAAASAGICSAVLPLDQIAPWICKFSTGNRK